MRKWTLEQTKANRAKLTAALRSGEYTQGNGRLHPKDGTFCCLGVACDLAIKEGIIDGWLELHPEANCYGLTVTDGGDQRSHSAYLPDVVKEWLGFASDSGAFESPADKNDGLAYMNDHGATFAEIANIIDSEPKGLIANVD